MGLFSKGLKNEFETAVVNEPSVFEPLKFYCSCCIFLQPFSVHFALQLSIYNKKIYFFEKMIYIHDGHVCSHTYDKDE